jgi:succinate dehydrogenase/fumarate reductase flavoprotein subunit
MSYIVVGGGLAGLSAAHTILQAGESVTLLERNMFMVSLSTKTLRRLLPPLQTLTLVIS